MAAGVTDATNPVPPVHLSHKGVSARVADEIVLRALGAYAVQGLEAAGAAAAGPLTVDEFYDALDAVRAADVQLVGSHVRPAYAQGGMPFGSLDD